MTPDDINRMAEAAGFPARRAFSDLSDLYPRLERFAALVAAAKREKVVRWMMERGYATGHGDTIEDLLTELEWQVRESEREACAKLCDDWPNGRDDVYSIGVAIRARGEMK